jgi:uncharacterized protein with NRDE domain
MIITSGERGYQSFEDLGEFQTLRNKAADNRAQLKNERKEIVKKYLSSNNTDISSFRNKEEKINVEYSLSFIPSPLKEKTAEVKSTVSKGDRVQREVLSRSPTTVTKTPSSDDLTNYQWIELKEMNSKA